MTEATNILDPFSKTTTSDSKSSTSIEEVSTPSSKMNQSSSENMTTTLPSLASSTSTPSATTPATGNTTPAVISNQPVVNVSPIYVFIDFESTEEYNLNKILFTGASYMVVDTPEFNIIQKKDYRFGDIQDQDETAGGAVSPSATFQDFIQDLSDSIHTCCIVKEKPFTFISARGWDLRLKFIKHAKEVGAQLPNYLEYPRYFDLKKEFMKYEELNQMAEFNSIDYASLSLNVVRETLSIDSIAETGSNVEMMLSIVKKIFETNTSPYIFKKPHDMNLDLSHFFIEKSRIIYMTNLPSDTTQSELESWFNQFNGRAIAFWSIKSPALVTAVSNQSNDSSALSNNANAEAVKTCSGFAIFASHEDAIESLSMNGQTLNERLIELQPSSVRVLDKAQDILSPFPSSKNKPRPGDWTCPSCGFSNFQRRTACFRCSFPAASAAAVQESIYGNGSSANGSSINLQNKGFNSNNLNHNMSNTGVNSMNYNSNSNHYNNYNSYNGNSNNYNLNKNDSNGNGYSISMSGGNVNINNNGSNNGNNNNNNGNSNSGYSSRQSSNVPFRAGDWKCLNETCAYHNFAKNVCCLKCGAPRVQSAIINGHAHNQHRNNSDGNNANGTANNGNTNNGNHHHNVNHNHHHNNKNNFNHNSQHIMNSNYSSRSNSLPSHMNTQFNQNSQHYGNNQYMQNQNQAQQQNYNKFKSSASDVYNMDLGNRSSIITSVPGTPTINGVRGNSGYSTNTPTNMNMASNQLLKGDNTTYDLASRIGGLSLNHTGASGSSSVSGTSGMNNVLNMNIPNLNLSNMNNMGLNSLSSNMSNMNNAPTNLNMNMNMNMNMNSMGSIGGMSNLSNVGNMNSGGLNGLNGLDGLNGLNVLNGLNSLSGLNNLGRTLSSPIVSGSPAVGGGSSAGTGFTSIGDIDRSSGMGGEESVTGSSFVESNGN